MLSPKVFFLFFRASIQSWPPGPTLVPGVLAGDVESSLSFSFISFRSSVAPKSPPVSPKEPTSQLVTLILPHSQLTRGSSHSLFTVEEEEEIKTVDGKDCFMSYKLSLFIFQKVQTVKGGRGALDRN